MINLKTVEQIKLLGFSEYEAKCYLALLERESLSVSEVSRLAGVPRTNAYEAMERLLVKGLCVSLPGKIKRFSASDPSLIKEKSLAAFMTTKNNELKCIEKKQKEIIEQRDKELQYLEKRRQDILEKEKNCKLEVEDVANKLNSIFMEGRSNRDPLEYIKVLKNPMQIHSKFIELFSNAEKEVLIFCKPPFAWLSEKERKKQHQVQNEATKRGVVVRGIFEMPPEDQAEKYFKARSNKTPTNPGDESRIIDKLPIKLNIFDNKICFFTLVDPIKEKTSLTMLVAEHEALTLSFRMLFEYVWKEARDYFTVNGQKYYLYDRGGNEGGGI